MQKLTNQPTKKGALPVNCEEFTEAQIRQAVEHCRKMLRDGMLSTTLAVMNTAVALYNLEKFKWFERLGPEGDHYKSFAACVAGELNMTPRHAKRYVEIGSAVATALGGGFISQQQVESLLERRVLQGKIGFRNLHLISQTAKGMNDLLSSNDADDAYTLIEKIRKDSQDLKFEAERKPKTALKALRSNRFNSTNLPTQAHMTTAINTLIRQINNVSSNHAAYLVRAVEVLPEGDPMRESKKHRRQMQEVWNALRRLYSLLGPIESVWGDEVEHVTKIQNAMTVIPEAIVVQTVHGKRAARIQPEGTPDFLKYQNTGPDTPEEIEKLKKQMLGGPEIING